MRRIQAKKHKVGTYEIEKTSLSVFDDKQSVLNNGVDTLTYFHKDLKKIDLKKEGKKFSQMMRNKNKCAQIKNILTNDDNKISACK